MYDDYKAWKLWWYGTLYGAGPQRRMAAVDRYRTMDLETLCDEYMLWVKYHGDGRNGDDLRFGQYLHNKYGDLAHDVFYFESAKRAFAELIGYYV